VVALSSMLLPDYENIYLVFMMPASSNPSSH